ncbi:MAG: sodium:solute symporter [Acidobacteriota bacterium]
MSIAAINAIIVAVYFGLTLWIGRRFAGPQTTLDDYLLAGRNMPWWAAAFSIVATETSTLTFIGLPGIAYGGDLTFLQVALGYVVGRFVVALVLVPGYFAGRFDTAYEVLAKRFGGNAQTTASLIFVINRVLADGVRLFATALVIIELLPLGLPQALHLPVSIALVVGVTLYYTLRGGLRAVIWNDVVQQFIYVGGAIVSAIILLRRIPGGWTTASAELIAAGKLQWLNTSLDFSIPYTLIGGLIGGAVLTMATHGTDQMFVQRLLATGSPGKARRAVIASGMLVFAQIALFLWIGTLLYAYYLAAPPSQPFTTNDAVFPNFIAYELPLGVGGLVIAAVFAAAMSTLSSSLSSLASTSTVDLWGRRTRHMGDDGPVDDPAELDHALRLSHRFTIVWAVALAGVAFLAQAWGSVLEAGLTITSITFGAVLGIFLVGQTRWRVSANQASIAMAAGIVALVAVHLAGGLAWTWFTLLGALVTIVSAALLALLAGPVGRAQ